MSEQSKRCNTYDEMNQKIVGILRVGDNHPSLYAAQRIEELEEQLERERRQKENCMQAYNDMETRYNNLKIANGALQSHSSGDYIAWIHGEENHLESLSCNVMIHADDLRSLVNEQLEQAQHENKKLIEAVGYYAEENRYFDAESNKYAEIHNDNGQKARDILKEVQYGTSG